MTEVNSDAVLVTYDGVQLQMSVALSTYFEKNPEKLVAFVEQMKSADEPKTSHRQEVAPLSISPPRPSTSFASGLTETRSLNQSSTQHSQLSQSITAPGQVPATSQTDKINWSSNSTKLLISERIDGETLFQGKMSHKAAWKKVADKINVIIDVGVSGEQCQWKWNKLVQKYKECCDHNAKSGNDHKTFEFMDQLDSFLGTAPNVTPTVTIGSMSSGGDGEEVRAEKAKGKKRRAVKSETLDFLRELKEDRERQHKETLDAYMNIQREKMALAREALEIEKKKIAQRGEL